MEQNCTIWTQNIPDVVIAALEEQWAGSVRPATKPEEADVFLVAAGAGVEELRRSNPAVPQVELSLERPARLGALMRQIANVAADPALWLDTVALGRYTLYPQDKILTAAEGSEIQLTDKEVDILIFLARHSHRAVSRDDLLRRVWRYQQGVDTHTLETHIYRLRQKIGDTTENPYFLLTEEGGYRLNLSGEGV